MTSVDGAQPGLTPEMVGSVEGLDPSQIERAQFLINCAFDLADPETHFSDITREYMSERSGNLRLCLQEIREILGPTSLEQEVNEARTAYLDLLLDRPAIFRSRKGYKDTLTVKETEYVDAFLAKIETILRATSVKDAICLGQEPSILRTSTFSDDAPSIETFAGNHLYLLQDTALKEHALRRDHIDVSSKKGWFSRLIGNRAVRMTIAGAIFTAVILPHTGAIPASDEYMAQEVELALRVLTGTILVSETIEAVRLKSLDYRHGKDAERLKNQLAQSKQLSDLALRMTYGQSRYGGESDEEKVTDRFGVDNPDENLRRFAIMDNHFPRLYNDPGGRPYNGQQALTYAARVLIERDGQVKSILEDDIGTDQRYGRYLDLSRNLILEDLARMNKGLSYGRSRQVLLSSVAVLSAAILPGVTSTASEARTLGRETTETIRHQALGPDKVE